MARQLSPKLSPAHQGIPTRSDRADDALEAFLHRQRERVREKFRRRVVRCRQRQLLAASDATEVEQRGYTHGGAPSRRNDDA